MAVVTGGANIRANMAKEIAAMRRRAEAGLVEAARLVKERAVAKTPVDTGELADSAYIKQGADGVDIGFNAPHAEIVHEDLNAEHPTGEAKFLENAIAESATDVVRIVQKEAKVK